MVGYAAIAVIERALIILLSAYYLFSAISQSSDTKSLFFGLAKSILVSFLILFNSKAKKIRVSYRSLVGLALSFGGFWIFQPPASFNRIPALQMILSASAIVFYFGLMIVSYINIGSNFGVTPAIRKLVTKGMYSIVRHPIYSCFVHLVLIYFFLFPSWNNLLGTAVIYLGIWLRLIEEEQILTEIPEYAVYAATTPSKIFSWVHSLPVIFIAITSFHYNLNVDKTTNNSLRLQLAHPVVSLDPRTYDDWSSIFVANHVFPRLFDNQTESRFALTSRYESKCVPDETSKCATQILMFEIPPLTNCSQSNIGVAQIRREIELIMNAKPWILPGWSLCRDVNAVCLRGPQTDDLDRRLMNIYFRFGWSTFDFESS